MLSAPWPVGDSDLVTWYLKVAVAAAAEVGAWFSDSVMGIEETYGNPHNPPRGYYGFLAGGKFPTRTRDFP